MSPAGVKKTANSACITSISLSNTKHGKLAYLKQVSFTEDSLPLFHAFKYVYAFAHYLKCGKIWMRQPESN